MESQLRAEFPKCYHGNQLHVDYRMMRLTNKKLETHGHVPADTMLLKHQTINIQSSG